MYAADLQHVIVPHNGVIPDGHPVLWGCRAIVASHSDVGYLSVTVELPVEDVIVAFYVSVIEVDYFARVWHCVTHVFHVVHKLRKRATSESTTCKWKQLYSLFHTLSYLPWLKVGDVSTVFPVERTPSRFTVLQVVQGVGNSVHRFVHTVRRQYHIYQCQAHHHPNFHWLDFISEGLVHPNYTHTMEVCFIIEFLEVSFFQKYCGHYSWTFLSKEW